MAMKATKISWEDLPEDCWELIFARMDRHLVPTISLVSKSFLTITDRLHTTLNLPSCFCSHHLPRLNSRFPNLSSLQLSHPNNDLDGLLRDLAKSNLSLHSLRLSNQTAAFPRDAMRLLGGSSMRNTLKTLFFYHFSWLTDEDLLVVADCFPYLRQLGLHLRTTLCFEDGGDLLKGFTDKGICAISATLVNLVSLTICFNDNVSQQSFTSLSSNCPGLASIRANFGLHSHVPIGFFSSFASLSSLDLRRVSIDEAGLDRLSQSNLKLWKFALRTTRVGQGVSLSAMCRFLKSCNLLTHLELKFTMIIRDAVSSVFVASIPNVEVIHICNASLHPTILFDMLGSCPKLEEIVLTMNSVKMEEHVLHSPVHHKLRKLVMAGRGYSDETLARIGSICPNLESFYVGDIPKVTQQGIEAMRTRCANIKLCKRIDNWVWKEKEIKISSLDREAFSAGAF